MSIAPKRALSATAVAFVAASTLTLGPGPADAAGLSCHASMSDATPKRYSNVYVRVRTAPAAKVRTVAHYKTTNTAHRKKANRKGRASIKYYISSATAGYRVHVDVTVSKNGHSKHCSTSFVPHN